MNRMLWVGDMCDYGNNVQAVVYHKTTFRGFRFVCQDKRQFCLVGSIMLIEPKRFGIQSAFLYQDQDCNQDIEQKSAACGRVNSFSDGLKLSLSLLLDCFLQSS